MSLLKGFTDELKATAAVAPLGIAADELLDSQVTKVGKFADSPIRLYAAFPTPDTKLYFRASVIPQGDGSSRIIPAIDDKVVASVDGSLDMQSTSPTIAGITLTRDGVAYTHPTATSGQFVRMAFVRKSDGSFDAKTTTAQVSLAAIQAIDPGTLWSALDGLPNGYVDLECTSTSPIKFKTAGSATSIIENSVSASSRIFNVGAGGGAGGGSDRTYKISSITATVATIKGGYRGIDDKRVLSSGAGTTALTAGADVAATLATVLTQSGLSFVANRIYALVIDLTTLSAKIALDNKREVFTWTSTNLKLLNQADLTLIDPRRYVLIDQIFVPTGATDWATSQLIQWTQQVHDTLTSYFPNIQRYPTQITSASASNILTHGLDGEPQIVQVFYYDGTNKNGKDLSSHLINKNATQLNVSSFGLTFGGGQYLEVTALYIPTVPNIASASRAFTSQWFTSNAVTTVPHGLSDMEDIRGYAVHEWDTVAAKRIQVDPSKIIINFDAVNFYLDFVGSGVSATKQFRIVAGGSPLPWSIPDGQFDTITNRSGAGAPNFPNGATGITTGINSSPIVKRLTKQTIGAVGSSGQVAGGHTLTAKSFPAASANLSWWPLSGATSAADGTANARTGTVVGAGTFVAAGLQGETNGALNLPGSSDFRISSSFFTPVTTAQRSMGLWAFIASMTPASSQGLFGQSGGTGATTAVNAMVNTDGTITFSVASTTLNVNDKLITVPAGLLAAGWHHFVLTFDATNVYVYIDGDLFGSLPCATIAQPVSSQTGYYGTAPLSTTALTGRVANAFFNNAVAYTAEQIRKIASYRYDHAAGVAVGDQQWSVNFYGTMTDEDGTPSGWMVDKYDTDTLFLDFSDRAATDQVEMFMESRALSPTTVGSVVPYDVIHTVNPTFPIAHGQAGVPELVAEGELTSGVWEPLTLTGQVSADSTNLVSGSTLAPFFTAGYLRVRLIARNVGPVQTGVPVATTGISGLVGSRALGHQKMGGLKGFLDGAYSIGNLRDLEGAGTTVLSDDDRRHQVFNLTAARTVTMPSTSVLKGDEWVIENRAAFDLTVQSSGVNVINLLQSGRMILRALQDAPTSSAHWQVTARMSFIPSNIRALESTGTTTLTDGDIRTQVFNLSAARTVVLPTTAIKSGDVWTIHNQGAFDLSVQTSDASPMTLAGGALQDATIRNGYVILVALQDAPTTELHWRVTEVYETYALGTITTANSGALTTNNVTMNPILVRHNKACIMSANGTTTAVCNVSSSFFRFIGVIPTRFVPFNDPTVLTGVRDGGTTAITVGYIEVDGSGNIYAWKNVDANANFTAGNVIAINKRFSMTWATIGG